MEKYNSLINEKQETGDEQLTILIKKAGDDARKIKKKIMDIHYKKLKAGIAEGVARRKIRETS